MDSNNFNKVMWTGEDQHEKFSFQDGVVFGQQDGYPMSRGLLLALDMLSSLPGLFLTSLLFTVSSFRSCYRIVDNIRKGIVYPLLFGTVNGIVFIAFEVLVDRNFPRLFVFFVPLVTVLEILCGSKNSFRVYLFIFGAFLVNFSGIHSLVMSLMGLFRFDSISLVAVTERRVFVVSCVLLVSSLWGCLLLRLLPLGELHSIVYSRVKARMLMVYMFVESLIFFCGGKVVYPLMYQLGMDNASAQIFQADMFLKNFTLLAGGYVILLFSCREEGHRLRAVSLKRDLQVDALTGLTSRFVAEKAVRECLLNKERDGAFFIIDVDNFKLVNDRLGHPEGDRILCEVANVIKTGFRSDDIVARLGGDEFYAYAPGLTTEEAVCRCVSPLLERCRFEYDSGGKSFAVTLSIGVVFASNANHDYALLYKCADEALYKVKQGGKSGWHLYHSTAGGVT